jgi:ABC-type phosphate transport system substrate-binding protein
METNLSPPGHQGGSRLSQSAAACANFSNRRNRRVQFAMRNKLSAAYAVAGLLAGGFYAVPASAVTPTCSSLTTNPVFISGSSAAKPILQALAKTLYSEGSTIGIIYQNPDSCLGVADFLANGPSTEMGISTLFLGNDGTTTTACTLDSGTPQPVDIAASDVFPATCGVTVSTAMVGTNPIVEVQGPIQAMTFAVPGGGSGSNATSISAEAAYVVFGYDATNYTVPQWNQPTNIFVRPQTSGTENMIGTAMGLVSSKWANATTGSASAQQKASGGAMQTAIASVASNQNATIGILAAENVATFNNTATPPPVPLKILAYQHTGQKCGYLPDSSQGALDKINVRQGRYAIWGPVHFLAAVSGGEPAGPHAGAVATVLNYFLATGQTPTTTPYMVGDAGGAISTADKQALIAAEAKPGYVVPWCAMQVLRTTEMGAEASYQPAEPCGCFYESSLGATVQGHTCTTCTSNSNCSGSTPTCRYGFCEVQ